jgi:hypothetical protein
MQEKPKGQRQLQVEETDMSLLDILHEAHWEGLSDDDEDSDILISQSRTITSLTEV